MILRAKVSRRERKKGGQEKNITKTCSIVVLYLLNIFLYFFKQISLTTSLELTDSRSPLALGSMELSETIPILHLQTADRQRWSLLELNSSRLDRERSCTLQHPIYRVYRHQRAGEHGASQSGCCCYWGYRLLLLCCSDKVCRLLRGNMLGWGYWNARTAWEKGFNLTETHSRNVRPDLERAVHRELMCESSSDGSYCARP